MRKCEEIEEADGKDSGTSLAAEDENFACLPYKSDRKVRGSFAIPIEERAPNSRQDVRDIELLSTRDVVVDLAKAPNVENVPQFRHRNSYVSSAAANSREQQGGVFTRETAAVSCWKTLDKYPDCDFRWKREDGIHNNLKPEIHIFLLLLKRKDVQVDDEDTHVEENYPVSVTTDNTLEDAQTSDSRKKGGQWSRFLTKLFSDRVQTYPRSVNYQLRPA
ncbi:hypothetical protein B0H14DRAFT_2649251 [Mycena olivaceomarginata]|nr:hypothetical protein B0H14DRAFT_2649251 [Mycena olivaceomarginata]